MTKKKNKPDIIPFVDMGDNLGMSGFEVDSNSFMGELDDPAIIESPTEGKQKVRYVDDVNDTHLLGQTKYHRHETNVEMPDDDIRAAKKMLSDMAEKMNKNDGPSIKYYSRLHEIPAHPRTVEFEPEKEIPKGRTPINITDINRLKITYESDDGRIHEEILMGWLENNNMKLINASTGQDVIKIIEDSIGAKNMGSKH